MERELYLPMALVWLIGSIVFSCIACLTEPQGSRKRFRLPIALNNL